NQSTPSCPNPPLVPSPSMGLQNQHQQPNLYGNNPSNAFNFAQPFGAGNVGNPPQLSNCPNSHAPYPVQYQPIFVPLPMPPYPFPMPPYPFQPAFGSVAQPQFPLQPNYPIASMPTMFSPIQPHQPPNHQM